MGLIEREHCAQVARAAWTVERMSAKILIVEDEMLVALELEAILEELGHQSVGIAPDLATAAVFYENVPDLALVDLNLRDGLTGPEIGKRLSVQGVTVLFITANPRELGDGIAGTVGVLTKPTDQETVRGAVEYALGLRQGVAKPVPQSLKLFG